MSGGRVRRQAQLPLVSQRFSWRVEAGGPRSPCPPFPTVEAILCRHRKVGATPPPAPVSVCGASSRGFQPRAHIHTWKPVLVSPVLPKLCTGLRIPERGAGPLRVVLTLFWRHPAHSPELPTRLSLPPTPQGHPGGAHGGGAAGEAELSPALAAVQVTPRRAVLARAAGGRVASRRTPVEAAAREESLCVAGILHPREAGAESRAPFAARRNHHLPAAFPRGALGSAPGRFLWSAAAVRL